MITREDVIAVLDYNPSTGVFVWKVDRAWRKVGSIAGTTNKKGYRTLSVLGSNYYAHRIAWLVVYGRWPTIMLDHIDGVKSNNAIANLRECSNAENKQNIPVATHAASGKRGAYFCNRTHRWYSTLKIDGRMKFLGYFDSADKANEAFVAARKQHLTFAPELRA